MCVCVCLCVPVYVNALIVNAEPVGWLVVTDALCSFSHSVDYAHARDLFFFFMVLFTSTEIGRRMGEGMRAQVHLPVRTAPELLAFPSSSFMVLYVRRNRMAY